MPSTAAETLYQYCEGDITRRSRISCACELFVTAVTRAFVACSARADEAQFRTKYSSENMGNDDTVKTYASAVVPVGHRFYGVAARLDICNLGVDLTPAIPTIRPHWSSRPVLSVFGAVAEVSG